MSREIKFRAWDKKRKCYAKVIQTTNQGWKGYRDKTYITNGVMRFSKWVLNRFIIEQDTGLKDKNGKEIWVGDIVKCWDEDCGEVYFDTISLQYRVKFSDGDDEDLASSEPEVIGTIHDSPELLGGGE